MTSVFKNNKNTRTVAITGLGAITGIGLITPLGHNKHQWFTGLCEGRRVPRPFEDYTDNSGRTPDAFIINDFDPFAVLQTKGL